MRLSFQDGKFVAQDGDMLQVAQILKEKNAGVDWLAINPDDYVTSSLRAAAQFRQFADIKTKKIFDRLFNKFYELDPSAPLPSFLDPHQKDGVEWILTRSRSYLAHAPGAGKTAQAIVAAMLCKGVGQTVFIVPPYMTVNWSRELSKWIPEFFKERERNHLPNEPWMAASIVPLTENQDHIDWRSDFIICPDSMITKPWVLTKLQNLKKKFVAVDEASRFKERTSKRTIALFGGVFTNDREKIKSRGLIQDTIHSVLLDGSPMPNRPSELWAPTYAMNPETIDCMEYQDFGMRYCGPTLGYKGAYEFKHSSNESELKEKLQRNFMHVVPESALDHPERKRFMLFMTEDPRTLEMKSWEQKNLSKISFKDIGEGLSKGEIASHRRELGIKKIKWVASYTKERLETNNESLLLFAWHREVVLGLWEALKKYQPGLVMGGTNEKEREITFERFQAGKIQIIIGNILAMGRGHNLQKASRTIFAEWCWNDEYNKQCEKRASRKGSEHKFTRNDYIVAPNTMDEITLNSVFTGQKRVGRIIG